MSNFVLIGNVIADSEHITAVYQRSEQIATIYFDNLDEIDADIDDKFDLAKIADLINS